MSYPSYKLPFHDPCLTEQSLHGAVLIQVAVGEHQIQLHWDNGISMLCEGDLQMQQAGSDCQTIQEGRDAAPLLQLLGSEADRAEILPEEYFQVCLRDGSIIRLLTDNSGRENFQIKIHDQWVMIW